MATPAQKHFRNEMRELQKEGVEWYDKKYHYPKRGNKKKWSWGLVVFILFALFASGIPMKLYHDLTVSHDQRIRAYVQEREQYFSASDQSFKQVMNDINQLQNESSQSLLPSIKETKTTIELHYEKVKKMKPPKHFKDFHKETIQHYVMKLAAIDYIMDGALENRLEPTLLDTYINEMNIKLSALQPKLIEALQKSDLRYQIEPDGTITYWVKQHQYQSF